MVMESPSPECVGREFVRQYYTLMNEAPHFLHRFYSSSSSFVHSGVDRAGQEEEVVHGQKDIHKKIKELDFKDCHTKIRQVDSQATIGDGVVVQVTGELSNQRGPMRRFMQTFVLAHQPPKQYYVNNDIFRYQDEVFQDSESEEEKELRNTETVQENEVVKEPVEEAAVQSDVDHPPVSTSPVFISAPVVPSEQPTVTSPTAADKLDIPQHAPEPEQAVKVTPNKVEQEKEVVVEHEAPPISNDGQPASDKPKEFSWANVAASGGSTSVAVVPPMSAITNANKQSALPLATITAQQQKEDAENAAISPPFPVEEPVVQQAPNRGAAEANTRPPRHDDRGGDRRTNERFPDNTQVFVGNLPVDIADLELKRFFNTYGKVVDIRVNRSASAGKVPFGFVVFETAEPVTTLLRLRRVEMNGHRLNVEEKKARNDRAGSNSRRGPRTGQRGGSRPKDRENSNTRSEGRSAQQGRKFGR